MSSDPAPFFSVITPTFNRGRILARAIDSVLAQSFEQFEYIIVDDGSSDDTREVVAPYLAADSRIQYRYCANQGTSLARDAGASIAHGRYITFLDSDDEYLPNHLELREHILSAEPAIELLHGGVEIIGSPYVADKNNPSVLIDIRECRIGGTFFIRRDLWKRLGGFGDVRYGDDSDFFSRAELHGALIQKTDSPTYRYYRNEPDSLCRIVEAEGIDGIERYRSLKIRSDG